MKKEEFLIELRKRLNGLPKEDIDERISFYSEMIDDRIESRKTEEVESFKTNEVESDKIEEEVINEIGSVDEVIADIAKDTPMLSLVKQKIKPKRRVAAWEIVLIILGFPIWFPLLLVGLILFTVGYFILWILEFVLYIVDVAMLVAGGGSFVVFLMALTDGKLLISYLGMSLAAFGLAGLLFVACFYSTKGVIKLTKRNAIAIKSWFIKGGKNEKVN